jgi:hypothetical protein
MNIQNRLAGIAEGLHFLKHQYERDLLTTLRPEFTKWGMR